MHFSARRLAVGMYGIPPLLTDEEAKAFNEDLHRAGYLVEKTKPRGPLMRMGVKAKDLGKKTKEFLQKMFA